MLRPVRVASSVSVASPPASAIVSSKYSARSTDWMLCRWLLSFACCAGALGPCPAKIGASMFVFSLPQGKAPRPIKSRRFQDKEGNFRVMKNWLFSDRFCPSSFGHKAKLHLECGAKHLAKQNVHFLNTRRRCRRHRQEMVGEQGHVAAALGAKRGGDQPHRPSLFKGGDHIRTFSGRRDSDGDIAGLSQSLDLAREYAFEAKIVARGRER